MTGWLIFGGVILFILGLLMIPVHITADYKENLSVKIRFLLFFKLNVFPFEEKEKAEQQKPKKQKKEKAQEKQQKPKRKIFVVILLKVSLDNSMFC
jgi:putative Mn2+ efflux pump MntP